MGAEKNKRKIYLIGGGIASLSAAAYLIKDGEIPGENITILEASDKLGGSMDSHFDHSKEKCIMRGYRAFEEKAYSCTFDLFSFIPSLRDEKETLKDEFFKFNKKVKIYAKSRLVKNGKIVNAKPLKLNFKDRTRLFKLLATPEFSLESLSIENYFTPSFFETNFWIEFCTIFSFQPWHSLAEFRRYFLRLIQNFPVIDTVRTMKSAPCNQYEFIILPVLQWLKKQGVNFTKNCKVVDLDFKQYEERKTISHIHCIREEIPNKISVGKNDLVFITLGSITEGSRIGSMRKHPELGLKEKGHSWELWENISKDNPDFGNPSFFAGNTDKSKWISFSITFRNSTFFKLVKKITKKEAGSDGPITLKDSNWLISVVLPRQPYFSDQPKHLNICWGYCLRPDKKGNFVNKKMEKCSGKEILIEICNHLGFSARKIKDILESADCVPCFMPYITSQFFPRKKGDRPQVVPENAANFAFLGQYCEIPEEITFTVEYSIRSAQIAVYQLLDLDKKPSPIYKGQYNLKILWNAIKTAFR